MVKIISAMFIIFFISFAAGSSLADIVYLKNGAKLEGKVHQENDDEIILELPEGKVVFNKSEIERVEKKEFVIEQTGQPVEIEPMVCPKETFSSEEMQGWREKIKEWEKISLENKKVAPQLIDTLRNDDGTLNLDVGAMVIYTLGTLARKGIKDNKAALLLIAVLEDDRKLSMGFGVMMKYDTLSKISLYTVGAYKLESAIPVIEKIVKRIAQDNLRTIAIEALGEIGSEKAMPLLVDILLKVDLRDFERREALISLKTILMANEKSMDYLNVIIPALITSLGDDASDNRAYAEDVLKEIGTPAVPSLVSVLKNKKNGIKMRTSAANTLRVIGYEHKIPAEVTSDIAESLKDEKDYFYLFCVLNVLENLDDNNRLGVAVPILLNVLKTSESMKLDDKKNITRDIFCILTKVQDEKTPLEVIPIAIRALDGEYGEEVVDEAFVVLMNAGESTFPYIAERCRKDSGKLLLDVGVSLVKNPEPSFVKALIRCLKIEDKQTRERAVNLLLQIKDKKVIPMLIDALDDKDKDVRKNILYVLRKLTGRRYRANSNTWKKWWEKEKDIFEMRYYGIW